MNDELVFTPVSLLDLLSQIDELNEYNINITETLDSQLQLQIGDSVYEINTDNASVVSAPEDVVDNINDVNDTAYEDLIDSNVIDSIQPVESGVIKQLAKTLLVGGLVRLTTKLLK